MNGIGAIFINTAHISNVRASEYNRDQVFLWEVYGQLVLPGKSLVRKYEGDYILGDTEPEGGALGYFRLPLFYPIHAFITRESILSGHVVELATHHITRGFRELFRREVCEVIVGVDKQEMEADRDVIIFIVSVFLGHVVNFVFVFS